MIRRLLYLIVLSFLLFPIDSFAEFPTEHPQGCSITVIYGLDYYCWRQDGDVYTEIIPNDFGIENPSYLYFSKSKFDIFQNEIHVLNSSYKNEFYIKYYDSEGKEFPYDENVSVRIESKKVLKLFVEHDNFSIDESFLMVYTSIWNPTDIEIPDINGFYESNHLPYFSSGRPISGFVSVTFTIDPQNNKYLPISLWRENGEVYAEINLSSQRYGITIGEYNSGYNILFEQNGILYDCFILESRYGDDVTNITWPEYRILIFKVLTIKDIYPLYSCDVDLNKEFSLVYNNESLTLSAAPPEPEEQQSHEETPPPPGDGGGSGGDCFILSVF